MKMRTVIERTVITVIMAIMLKTLAMTTTLQGCNVGGDGSNCDEDVENDENDGDYVRAVSSSSSSSSLSWQL